MPVGRPDGSGNRCGDPRRADSPLGAGRVRPLRRLAAIHARLSQPPPDGPPTASAHARAAGERFAARHLHCDRKRAGPGLDRGALLVQAGHRGRNVQARGRRDACPQYGGPACHRHHRTARSRPGRHGCRSSDPAAAHQSLHQRSSGRSGPVAGRNRRCAPYLRTLLAQPVPRRGHYRESVDTAPPS